MALQKAINKLSDSNTAMKVGYVGAGYFVASRGVKAVVETPIQNTTGMNVPDEVWGVLTAGAFYGYGGEVMKQSTADMMALGGLTYSLDELTNREQIRSILEVDI